MPSQYPRSPKLIKGALIQFSAQSLLPVPQNIIVFQYNPETLSRTISPWGPSTQDGKSVSKDPKELNHLAQPFDPSESFTLALELDAADALEEPERHPVAVISGVADRIAAMEMLLYAEKEGGASLGLSIATSLAGALGMGGSNQPVPEKSVPVVLFFWGPGRIVPVRLSSLTVDEQAYSPTLYPIRAKVSIGLTVLDARSFEGQNETAAMKIAKACYRFTRAQQHSLADANVTNTVESIIGMLPF